ncbi:GNAT family N-acetyltransferase [Halomonas denitrificans]|uniref:tRNA(Met) cytidine acetyltransferase TmcA n=1 Tax=Halomonas denitrificans TaxID=370769 RepID=UPI001CD4A80F|nr:GNAT family N-acetyltransferase [Halomonas denitrificans]MCA0975773.1 GNAT family N-acetyltransferase [Halomonas denitrificans]
MHSLVTHADLERLRDYRARLAQQRQRGMVWMTGSPEQVRRRALECLAQGGWEAPLWAGMDLEVVAEPARDEVEMVALGKARMRLGHEHDLLIVDALSPASGLDPDALGALSGTLVAGGLLLLLMPDDGGRQPDRDYRRIAAHPWAPASLTSHYLQRLHRLLGELDGVMHWHGDAGLSPARSLDGAPAQAPASLSPTQSETVSPSPDADCLTADQAEAVRRLSRLKRRRPLVITADRGRGKSAALGIACARMLEHASADSPVEILLTAPRVSSVEAVFARLVALLPKGVRDGNDYCLAAGRLRFMAPDGLSDAVTTGEAGGAGSVLLVDEAAAIPAALLGQWLKAFPRVAFATTVHGYEGSGRGFALRFRRQLDAITPQWQAMELTAPIRWAAGDPLEAAISALLCLDAEMPDVPVAAGDLASQVAALPSSVLGRAALAQDEDALRGIFGLLVQAHYRTTPSDLRALLDGPDTRLWVLGPPAHPVAVCVTIDEGRFDYDLAEQVLLGQRRPRGHLMAQSLAAHAGERGALTGSLRRVSRIAVHPDWRRCGCGARLLDDVADQASLDGCMLLGTSFGADPELLSFWYSRDYRPVRLGLTREAATGEHAVMLARSLTDDGQRILERLTQRFQRQLPGLLAFELPLLPPQVVMALLAHSTLAPPDDHDLGELTDLARGLREPALSRPAIQALIVALARLSHQAITCGDQGGNGDLAWLAAWAFQGRSESSLAAALSLSGKAQVKQWLRDAVGHGLDVIGHLSKPAEQG